jgi:hypothetical protein
MTFHKESKTLILGDTMNIKDGQLTGKNTQIMNEEEIKKVINSLKKFMEYDVENLITYYGGPFHDNPNKKIKELILGDLND